MPNIYIHNRCFTSQPEVGRPMADTMSYEKRLRIQKKCGQPYDICGVADYVGQDIVCLIFIIKL